MRSSTMALRLLLIFLISGAVGWIFSRRPAPAEAPTLHESPAAAAAPRKIQHPRSPQDFNEWAEDLATHMEPYGAWYKSYGAELADWPLEKIRAALAQGVTDPGAVLPMGNETKALYALYGEFSKRDPDAAWAWLQALPSEAMRAQLASALANAWPADRAEEGFALVVANRDYFESNGGYSYSQISVRAFESAAARGTAAVDELLGTLVREGMQMPFLQIQYPAGFDFAGWARCPEMEAMLKKFPPTFFIESWMSREPQAAMDFLFALNREQGKPLSRGLFDGLYRSKDAPEVQARRAQQIATHTGTLPPEEQQGIYEAAAETLSGNPAFLREFSASLPQPEMRAAANLTIAHSTVTKDLPFTLELLTEGRSPEERATVLEEILAAREPATFMPMSVTQESSVRQILAGWSLAPARIDELVKAINPH